MADLQFRLENEVIKMKERRDYIKIIVMGYKIRYNNIKIQTMKMVTDISGILLDVKSSNSLNNMILTNR